MKAEAPVVITIPEKPELVEEARPRQLRVAAYCRVSTKDEQQLGSYEAQKEYYTDKIMTNQAWTMAGIYADEGITGTSARKRQQFLEMVRHCRQHKIDLILTKSISRFARNTVDSLNYIRVLRDLGIGVYFEEQNINTLDVSSEFLVTLYSAFAQSESESISGNIRWGKRQAMREGKAIMQYKKLYAFKRGDDGKPSVIPKQAEVVRRIYSRYLAGDSLRMIKGMLEREHILNAYGQAEWTLPSIRSILTNEKYCGDVLLQKTFIQDCISKKVIKNTGQLPMYLIPNHHEAIVDRQTYDAVQAEMARRNAGKSPSKKSAPTGRAAYSSKYALTERLVCGECGTLYRRVTWSAGGKKRIVWRCVSRLDYGKKYCHNSPTLDEKPLQEAILKALNSAMSHKDELIRQVTGAMELELAPIPGESLSLADIERRLGALSEQFQALLRRAAQEGGGMEQYQETFSGITNEIAALKERRAYIREQQAGNEQAALRVGTAVEAMRDTEAVITEWDESLVRQLVDTVKVISKHQIEVELRGGVQIRQEL
ncbi:recombinase family protein [Pseudoflavonifractor phocaeensis]|uniref:recombinase family protein n=1 Tax=Pseudoflavonifractor phocaeensis TaxID=1870988 RepID=UPI002108C35F|nr:recombinase family protein [Pseudoflavonifractor phocaeensis]MCQ4863491.1 recombinase family protein [Pseudoflavonifractor phocaeensis]